MTHDSPTSCNLLPYKCENHLARCPLDLTTYDAGSSRRRGADLSLQTVQPRALRHTKVVWSNSGPQSALHAVTTSHASQGFTSSSPVCDRIRLWFAFTVLFRGPVSTCESGPVTGYSRVRLGLRTFHSAASVRANDLLLLAAPKTFLTAAIDTLELNGWIQQHKLKQTRI